MKITIEKPEHVEGTEGARKDWAEITGQELTIKQATFRHSLTNEYYCHLIGGVSYPIASGQEIKPGVLLIIGIQAEPVVKYTILESFETLDVFKLIEKMVTMRREYQFGKDSRILPSWYGDQEKYQTLIIKASESLEKAHGINAGLYIKDTVDRREKHSFQLYVRQIFHALEKKTLNINGDKIVTGHLQAFQREDAEKGGVDNFPVAGLLGGMLHSLQIEKPWLEDEHGTVFNV
jgi:hypothetical protein